MAEGSLDSVTTTSHTLSADPPQFPPADLHPSSTSALTSTLLASPHTFLQPPPSLRSAALLHVKRLLDPIALAVSNAQAQRQREGWRKRKRGQDDDTVTTNSLHVEKLYLEGFEIDQVWEQARRVLEAGTDEVESSLPDIQSSEPHGNFVVPREDIERLQDRSDVALLAEHASRSTSGAASVEDDDLVLGPSDDDGSHDALQGNDISEYEHKGGLSNQEDDDALMDEVSSEVDEDEPTRTYQEDPNGLNDGFFSIDDFNKQTEFLERQDAVGDPNDGAASDEEDIDWDAAPVAASAAFTGSQAQTAHNRRAEEGDDSGPEDEDGPTFGDADLYAPESESDEELGDDLDDTAFDNANEIYYKNFFAPPPQKQSKRGRPSKHTREIIEQRRQKRQEYPSDDEAGTIQRTMDAVRHDLFDDEQSGQSDASGDGLSGPDPSNPASRRSTHERNQAKLAAEIRKLEAANVAKREWTLTGEARASDRPLNSLLEADLDFERTGKPVPVITAEVSEGIEDLIKRRILVKEFDEVLRRRPESLNDNKVRRGRFELDDSKPQQSLAEVYEEEHLRNVNPDGHKDKRDEKLKKEHAEIELLWKDVSAKLDSLSSWHYKPKPPAPSVNIVADVPTIAMEDAQPATAAGGSNLGASSMLAPQELYAPGTEKAANGEVVLRSGVPIAKAEMSREEKLRRRRREKERAKKKGGAGGVDAKPGKANGKKEVVGQLKKGGVKVIGSKGDVRDVDGKKPKGEVLMVKGGALKL
ncbi:MAG: U3 snoRNP protein [Piccolia ochrophora]|nr:MAG: U3 snoRNP protein [Piccolia ochrophora]